MGLIFVDGFDHYSTLSEKWDGSAQYAISALGRFSTNGVGSTDWGAYLGKSLTAIETVYVGFAINTVNGLPSRNISLLTLYDTGTIQCRFMIPTGTNFVRAYKGSTTTLLGTATAPIPMNGFHYIEFMAKIGSGDGEMHFKIDGVEVLTVTSADNRATSIDQVNSVRIGPNGSSGWSVTNYPLDDIYIADDAFKGDCRVETLMPESEGAYEQFLNPDSTPNYSVVDEVTPNTADYVYANLAGSTDSYGFPALDEIAGNIKGVAVNTYVQKDSSGTKTIGGFARVGGDEAVSAGQTVPSSWGFVQQFIDNPADSDGNWNVVDVNAAEFGQQVIS